MKHTPAARAAVAPGRAPAFVWKDFSRFVELHPVRTGWLVTWGHYTAAGREKHLSGAKTYVDFAGARHRLLDAVLELTNDSSLAAEAAMLLRRATLPVEHVAALPPAPL